MPCIKTGAQVFLKQYNEYVWCDAFALDAECNWDDRKLHFNAIQIKPVYLFRIVQRSFEPVYPKLHFTVHKIGEWFNNGGSHPDEHAGISTLFASNVTNHGYYGVDL